MYLSITKVIDADPTMVLDVLQARHVDEQSNRMSIEYEEKKVPGRILQDAPTAGQAGASPFLFYSRNLSTSILSIEQPDGTIRQYRLSTTVFQKNTHYFRCSRLVFICKHFQTMQFVNFELFNTCCIVDATI